MCSFHETNARNAIKIRAKTRRRKRGRARPPLAFIGLLSLPYRPTSLTIFGQHILTRFADLFPVRLQATQVGVALAEVDLGAVFAHIGATGGPLLGRSHL